MKRLGLGPLAVVSLALLAELTLSRVSGAPDFALFVGRFHPLIVHLPIGFFLLVAMGEAATFHPRLRERVEPALGLLVPVSALAALGAFVIGQLLALEGGFPAGALGWHRRLTLLAVFGMAACWLLFARQHDRAGRGRMLYRGALGLTLALLSLGAHFGGTLTRGESYLSKYAPGPLKPLLGAPEPETPTKPLEAPAPSAEPLVYQDVVQPLFTKYCVDCHGAEKQKGKLRLDSLEHALRGGEDGPALIVGEPSKSLLLTRMLLPVSDDDHMPPKDEPSPPPEAVELIRFWIERGASPTLKVRDALPPTSVRALLEHSLNAGPKPDSMPVSAPAAAARRDEPAAAPAPTAAPEPAGNAKQAGIPSPSSRGGNGPAAEPDVPEPPAATAVAATGVASSGPAVLAAYCEKCHGAAKQKGKLRVDSVAELLKGGKHGAALVPGRPEQSSIIQRIRLASSDDEHMPPAKERQPSEAEVATLVAWIRNRAGSAAASPLATKTTNGSTAAAEPIAASSAAPANVDAAREPPAATPATATSATTTPVTTTPATTTSATTTPAAAQAPVASAQDVSGPPEPALLAALPSRARLFHDAIQPLFREKCGKCHNKADPPAGLGTELRAQLLEGGYTGPGIVPKNRAASVVMQRLVLPVSDSDHMPPDDEPQLTADEIELVGAWIDQGAPDAPSETAQLSRGAARALSARGLKRGPEPLAAQAGGCAACSAPGAPRSRWLELQALSVALGAAAVLALRRRG